MKVGLLLEGGAMRGMYTAGVLDVLLENNIKVDLIIGVSAGALFGVNYKSRQKGRAYRFNSRYIHDKRYFGMYSLVTTGNILNQDSCFKDIPEVLDDSAILCNPLSVDEFTHAIVSIYNSLQFSKSLVSKGYANVLRFSWQQSAEVMKKRMDELL